MKKMFLALGIIVIVILGVFFIRNNMNSGISDNIPNTELNNTNSSASIKVEDLAKHNLESDCWVAFRGKVYDLTSWLPRHPGTAGAIMPYCGTSEGFEQAFTKKHGESKVSLLMKVGTFMGDFDVVGTV